MSSCHYLFEDHSQSQRFQNLKLCLLQIMASNVTYDSAHESVLFDPGEAASNYQFSSMRVRNIKMNQKRSFLFWFLLAVALSIVVNCIVVGLFSYLLINNQVENLFAKEIFGLQNRTEDIKADVTTCNGWESFKGEYCFKVFNQIGLKTFTEAEQACTQEGAQLVRIQSKAEQDFLTNLIFKKSAIVDHVWLGAKYSAADQKYHWIEDHHQQHHLPLTFTNWAAGNPKNLSNYCIEMHADVHSIGKWINGPCQKKNVVVCQKTQSWSLSQMQNTFLHFKQNILPIGFIYIQLPKEQLPSQIWPWITWKDVSSQYESVFFRVEGSESAPFGQFQDENVPAITQFVSRVWKDLSMAEKESERVEFRHAASIVKGRWSKYFYTGIGPSRLENADLNVVTQVHSSEGEVRPRNMAIRVWKRIE